MLLVPGVFRFLLFAGLPSQDMALPVPVESVARPLRVTHGDSPEERLRETLQSTLGKEDPENKAREAMIDQFFEQMPPNDGYRTPENRMVVNYADSPQPVPVALLNLCLCGFYFLFFSIFFF